MFSLRNLTDEHTSALKWVGGGMLLLFIWMVLFTYLAVARKLPEQDIYEEMPITQANTELSLATSAPATTSIKMRYNSRFLYLYPVRTEKRQQ